MSTLVCFHAHPDDESIATSGLMARAAAAGHRVILVVATDGAEGEPVPGVLDEGETLADRRAVEVAESAKIIGAEAPYLLGYRDSGMIDEPTNDHPDCFWQADIDEAAERLATILRDVDADVLTVYDNHGGYGHPDHIQVHRVGIRAAELAGTSAVYEATMNRDEVLRSMPDMPDNVELPEGDRPDPEDFKEMGTLEADLSYVIDVTDQIEVKLASMRAHRSQIADSSFFLAMPPEMFALAFGREHFNIPGRTDTGGPESVALLPGL